MGLALGCPRHNPHMEELGDMQPSAHLQPSLATLEAVMPTACLAYFEDL